MHACAGGGREEKGAMRGVWFVAGRLAACAELVKGKSRAWTRGVEGGGERFAVAVAPLGVVQGGVLGGACDCCLADRAMEGPGY